MALVDGALAWAAERTARAVFPAAMPALALADPTP